VIDLFSINELLCTACLYVETITTGVAK